MTRKLKNKQGATIMLALIFLLVATMVSCVVLVAASAAARAVDRERDQQQAYLTVSSAAQLLARELKDARLVFETVVELNNGTETVKDTRPPYVSGGDLLADRLTEGAVYLSTDTRYEKSFTITHTAKNGGVPQLEPVEVTLWMEINDKSHYVITIRLKNQDPDNPCQLYVHAESQDPTPGETGTDDNLTRSLTYSWDPVIAGQEVPKWEN